MQDWPRAQDQTAQREGIGGARAQGSNGRYLLCTYQRQKIIMLRCRAPTPVLRTAVRRLATARVYSARQLRNGGAVEHFDAVTPRELVDSFGIMARDCRLLSTSSAHIAVRDSYFLVRFPPFTGAVRHDSTLLIADSYGEEASQALQQRLTRVVSKVAPKDAHALSFEHRVLEAMLHEDAQYKRDRYERLSLLIEASTSPVAQTTTGSISACRTACALSE